MSTEMFITDQLACFATWLALGMFALFGLLTFRPSAPRESAARVGCMFAATVGLVIVALSRGLVPLFFGLELVLAAACVLLLIEHGDAAARGARAKYAVPVAFISAILLSGFALLYSSTGSTELGAIHDQLVQESNDHGDMPLLAEVALMLTLAGLGLKIYFCVSQARRETTITIAGWLLLVPQTAALIAIARILVTAMPQTQGPWMVFLVLAAVIMTVGNLAALRQHSLPALLLYSSLAQTGYMLAGLSVYAIAGSHGGEMPIAIWDGVAALLVYLSAYSVATIGILAALACFRQGDKEIDCVEELAGLAWADDSRCRLLAWAIAIFSLSLMGVPPLVGFWGKLVIIGSAMGAGRFDPDLLPWFVHLATIAAANFILAAAYHLRIVTMIFFRLPLATRRVKPDAGGPFAVTLCCIGLVILTGLYPGPWIESANCNRLSGPAASDSGRPAQEKGAEKEPPSQPAPTWEAAHATASTGEFSASISTSGSRSDSNMRKKRTKLVW